MNSRSNILIVEDSPEYQAIISRTLGEYNLKISASASESTVLLSNNQFELLIVDINLPDRDGFTLLAEVRSSPNTASTPVLCLTGRKDITDKVTAFSLGADDYITKPFDPLELQARVGAKLKSTLKLRNQDSTALIGDLEIDLARHRVSAPLNGIPTEISVTQTEFKLLCCLARRPEQVYTRDQLLIAAWGEDATVLERVVDVHICLLRKKLGPYSRYIKAVTGIGYKLVPGDRKKEAV